MDMRVFSEEAGIYNVDLAQLPAFGEDGHIVSVRDALVSLKFRLSLIRRWIEMASSLDARSPPVTGH